MATIHRITIHKWFNDPDNHDSVVSHLEPDILDSKLKQALGSITMSKVTEADGISAELFKILKDNAVKVLHSNCQQMWKTQQWPQVSFCSNRKEGQYLRMYKLPYS